MAKLCVFREQTKQVHLFMPLWSSILENKSVTRMTRWVQKFPNGSETSQKNSMLLEYRNLLNIFIKVKEFYAARIKKLVK